MAIRKIKTKRIYDPPHADDGHRVLVDRLWPRGIKKENAAIDFWAKQITPSNGLRKWFHEDRSRLPEFCFRYEAELKQVEPDLLDMIQNCDSPTLTLVSAVKDLQHGHVAVLLRQLEQFLPHTNSTEQSEDADE